MAMDYAFHLDNEPVRIIGSYLPSPVLSFNPGNKHWIVEQPYLFNDRGNTIVVPKGFQFDLASVPRPLWSIIAPFELSIVAPLIHDLLYVYAGVLPEGAVVPYRTYTRRQADDLFLEIMRREGIVEWRCRAAFNAVRTFGGPAWRGRLKEEEEMNIRLLVVNDSQ